MSGDKTNILLARFPGVQLTIGSYVSVRSSRYEARGKFGEYELVFLKYKRRVTMLIYEKRVYHGIHVPSNSIGQI